MQRALTMAPRKRSSEEVVDVEAAALESVAGKTTDDDDRKFMTPPKKMPKAVILARDRLAKKKAWTSHLRMCAKRSLAVK